MTGLVSHCGCWRGDKELLRQSEACVKFDEIYYKKIDGVRSWDNGRIWDFIRLHQISRKRRLLRLLMRQWLQER